LIKSFKNRCAEDIFNGFETKDTRKLSKTLHENAAEKLDMLHAAKVIDDLKVPPGNRLKPLKGDFKGYWSIRINDQWRIIFRWKDGNAEDVQICDYP
jgi:toxin HigB-1